MTILFHGLSPDWRHGDDRALQAEYAPADDDRTSGLLFADGAAGRIGAMMLRYWYMLRRSWTRILELVYWPVMSMLVWGFLQLHLADNKTTLAGVAGLLLGGVLLWDILLRGQLGFTFSFLEEVWSRNLGNLMMSPLRPVEFAAALMLMSLVRLLISTIPVTILAAVLFGFNI